MFNKSFKFIVTLSLLTGAYAFGQAIAEPDVEEAKPGVSTGEVKKATEGYRTGKEAGSVKDKAQSDDQASDKNAQLKQKYDGLKIESQQHNAMVFKTFDGLVKNQKDVPAQEKDALLQLTAANRESGSVIFDHANNFDMQRQAALVSYPENAINMANFLKRPSTKKFIKENPTEAKKVLTLIADVKIAERGAVKSFVDWDMLGSYLQVYGKEAREVWENSLLTFAKRLRSGTAATKENLLNAIADTIVEKYNYKRDDARKLAEDLLNGNCILKSA